MTTLTKPTTIRMDDALKKEAIAILDSIGLNFNTYVNLATRQLVAQRKVPFELVAMDVPTNKTRSAMIEAEAKELGLIEDKEPSFNDADSLIAYLEE
jgi:DNA-damage-inducible protein J